MLSLLIYFEVPALRKNFIRTFKIPSAIVCIPELSHHGPESNVGLVRNRSYLGGCYQSTVAIVPDRNYVVGYIEAFY